MIICSPQLGLAPNSILGGEVFDREILFGLAKKGVKVEIILPKNKSHDKYIKNWNITYLPISKFPALFGNLLYIPYLIKVYKINKFEILRVHQPQYIGIGCLLFKLIHKKVKLIATYHQFRESNFGPFSKFVNNLWDHIICDSQFVKNKLIKTYRIKSSKITVVHNGVPSYLKPTSKDQKLVQKLKLKGKIVLLFMGLFIERKNPLFLLDVLSKISQMRTDIVLIFLGEGPLKAKILQNTKKLGLRDKVRLIDPIFGPEKNKIHNLADIFVHSAVDEGFALSPLEAMACAKPIVMTDAYSAREMVDIKKNGFLCYFNDLNHWSEKLSTLISDDKLRERMGKASLIKVRNEFQWKFSIEKHVKVFRSLTK